MTAAGDTIPRIFYHGTRTDLKPGDLIGAGYNSNYGKRKQASWVYLTGTLDAAVWGVELAVGDGRGRIYVVQPTGPIADDPNLRDQKFPGNPTKSYRSRAPLRVTGEITDWQGHSPERLRASISPGSMAIGVAALFHLRGQGIEVRAAVAAGWATIAAGWVVFIAIIAYRAGYHTARMAGD